MVNGGVTLAIYTANLKAVRKKRGIRQKQMAQELNISQTAYSYYETGFRMMRADMLCKIADILNTSTDYILGRTESDEPYPPATKQ